MSKIQRLKSLGLTDEQIQGVLKLFGNPESSEALRAKRYREKRAVTRHADASRRVTPVEQNQEVKPVTRHVGGKGALAQGKIPSIDSPKVLELFPESLPKTAARARAKTGTRLAEDWVPEVDDTGRVAHECNLSPMMVAREFEKFRDYWLAKAGPNAIKRDWQATWRNWLRKSVEYSQQGRKAHEKPTLKESFQAACDLVDAKWARESQAGSGDNILQFPGLRKSPT